MKFISTKIEDVFIIEPEKKGDDRGWFMRTFDLDLFKENIPSFDCNWVQINQSYIKDDFYDNLRLDEHLIIDGTYIMMQEDRAWVDKPFANMKYQVAQDIFTLNYSSVKFWSELIIPILCYSYDITEKTFTTRDFVFKRTLNCEGVSEYNKFGEYRIKFFNISGNGRDSYGDYFSNGFSYKECESYIDCIYNHINNFVNDKIV
jgi:hypothetical protein